MDLHLTKKSGESMKKPLPIGIDDFRKVREGDYYYIDKSLMIKKFIEMQDEVALIARPRRFGKTLNMTMLREFFDITKDSRKLFHDLAIMSEYGNKLNTRPVIYFTFKNCKGVTIEELMVQLKLAMQDEYSRYMELLEKELDRDKFSVSKFYESYENIMKLDAPYIYISSALLDIVRMVNECYHLKPVLLIDEYDQPIMSSYEYGYHDYLGAFFSNFFGSAMKGNDFLGQALITGVQRVVKESIFSQFNNPQVYTVVDREYAPYFGLNKAETEALLKDYDLELTEDVQKMYDGYQIGGIEMYNPWSIINYAKKGRLENYWAKTSANFLVKSALSRADKNFWTIFDQLAAGQERMVWITLDTSFVERESNYSLWGLLVNAGYLTVTQWVDSKSAVVKIPNEEVMAEFQILVSEIAGIDGLDLQQMFDALLKKDMSRFLDIYQSIVIACTSYMDARENAYHMLFLGMCITLRGAYRVSSNIEAGYGRSDITLQALLPGKSHIIIEFKQGENIAELKEAALTQIMEQRYYTGLQGEILCVGLAHNKKRCEMVWKVIKL